MGILYIFLHYSLVCRARRRKKLAKALERQARKLRAKGITVDLDALRAEYLAQHRGAGNASSDDDEEDLPIDVVGGADSEDSGGEESGNAMASLDLTSSHRHASNSPQSQQSSPPMVHHHESQQSEKTKRPNPFSIESLLNT